MTERSSILVNLGCGPVWHQEWLNFDIQSFPPYVRAIDLRRPLPFGDQSVDAVYHSHVLEHLSQSEGPVLIGECLRVLRPGGTLRVVVPDLELIVRLYLQSLEAALRGGSRFKYEWAMLELYDQAVRQVRGGAMAAVTSAAAPDQREYLRSRVGDSSTSNRIANAIAAFRDSPSVFWARVRKRALGAARAAAVDGVVRIVCGKRASEEVRVGRFRLSGENHLWMYDRYSLVGLLMDAGFSDVIVMRPGESRIPNFGRFGLEIENGSVRKPDSLYVEGVRES